MKPANLGVAIIPPRASALSTTTDGSGFVTVAHGGPSIPVSVQLSGRNFGWYPYLTAVSATTFTVSFVSRQTGNLVSAATPVAFDWTCYF